MALQYRIARLARQYPILDKNSVTPFCVSEKRKKKILEMLNVISAEYSLLKKHKYYGSQEMQRLCQGTNDILGIEDIIETISHLFKANDKMAPVKGRGL